MNSNALAKYIYGLKYAPRYINITDEYKRKSISSNRCSHTFILYYVTSDYTTFTWFVVVYVVVYAVITIIYIFNEVTIHYYYYN